MSPLPPPPTASNLQRLFVEIMKLSYGSQDPRGHRLTWKQDMPKLQSNFPLKGYSVLPCPFPGPYQYLWIHILHLCFITNSSRVVYYFLQVWVKTLMVRICKFLHIVHPSAEEATLIPRRSFIIYAPIFQYHSKKYFTTFLNGL